MPFNEYSADTKRMDAARANAERMLEAAEKAHRVQGPDHDRYLARAQVWADIYRADAVRAGVN